MKDFLGISKTNHWLILVLVMSLLRFLLVSHSQPERGRIFDIVELVPGVAGGRDAVKGRRRNTAALPTRRRV